MLPNEATTRSEVITRPDRIEALVVAPSRDAARPLVAFLRAEKLNVTLVQDADSGFEEALLHRPNLVLIDEALPPAGGSELCERLKANGRTHFLPTLIYAAGGWEQRPEQRLRAIQAGADALLSDRNDDESRARLWALLRSEALSRRQARKHKVQGSVLKERGRWLDTFVHDLQNAVGALQANFEFLGQTALARSAERSEDVSDCVRETRALLQQLTRGLRTVQDFERLESGTVRPRQLPVDLYELLAEVKEDVSWQLGMISAPLAGESEGPVVRLPRDDGGGAPSVLGDRELLRQALGALATHLLRQPRTSELRAEVDVGPSGTRIHLISDGPALPEPERQRVFEPYARLSRRATLAQGIALAHARAILELHGGAVRAIAEAGDRAAFVVELKSRDPSPNHHLGP